MGREKKSAGQNGPKPRLLHLSNSRFGKEKRLLTKSEDTDGELQSMMHETHYIHAQKNKSYLFIGICMHV